MRRTRPGCLLLLLRGREVGADQVLHQPPEAHAAGPCGPAAVRSRYPDSGAALAPPGADPEPARPDRHRDADPHPALPLRAARPPRLSRAQPSIPRTWL